MALLKAYQHTMLKLVERRLRPRNPKSGLQCSLTASRWTAAAASTSVVSISEHTSPSWNQHGYFLPLIAMGTICGMAAALTVHGAQCEEEIRESDNEEFRQENSETPQVLASSMTQTLPALGNSSSHALADKPRFSIQRQRKLNGWAALEAKEDLKKVQLAQLLSGLHKLTQGLTPNSEEHNSIAAADDAADKTDKQDVPETGLIFPAEGLDKELSHDLIRQLLLGSTFTKTSFIQLIRAGAEVVRRDSTLLDLSEKRQVFVVGDLHGSIENLREVLNIVGDITDEKAVVFNGDFVDRGEGGVEVVSALLLLKMTYPGSVILVRGNHEDALLATIYGFEEEVRGKYGKKDLKDVWDALSDFFSALPLACKTPHAAIMHGGIPSEDFKLDKIQEIKLEERSQITSFMGDDLLTPAAKLVRDMLWSDPSMDNGLTPNENRGLGCHYGVDITRTFLENHGMHYLIRSHEVMDEGWDVIDCGDTRYVLTVFSTSAYPDGLGENKGAVLRLDNETGRVDPIHFKIPRKTVGVGIDGVSPMVKAIIEVIMDSKTKLMSAFEGIQSSDGSVTVDEWVNLMQAELEIDMDWPSIQTQIAPTKLEEDADGNFVSTNKIDWREFLERSSFSGIGVSSGDDAMESLFSNHAMLLTVFRFLDTDGNGHLDLEEFISGIMLLNEQLPEEQRFKDPKALFKTLDFDGSGEIDLDEFAVVSKPPDRAVLSKIFSSLDTDGSGTVDLEEFRAGIAKLNQKLPCDRQVHDPDALFKNLDMDGDGEVDIDEFSAFYF